jgi:hypothetical protein
MSPSAIIHAMYQFVPPVGVQFVQWQTHVEIRFLKTDTQTVGNFLRTISNDFDSRIDEFSREIVVQKCEHCEGIGQVSLNGKAEVCQNCSGSGREGFVVPGKGPKPVVEKKELTGPKTEPAPSPISVVEPASERGLFTREQLDKALQSCSADGGPVELEKLMAAIEQGQSSG